MLFYSLRTDMIFYTGFINIYIFNMGRILGDGRMCTLQQTFFNWETKVIAHFYSQVKHTECLI